MTHLEDIINNKGVVKNTHVANKELFFISTDGEEQFKINNPHPFMLDIYKDPNYPLIYKYNNKGYRTKNFEEFENQNFVLVQGCSYTEGVGLHEEHIWHSLISKELDLPAMNLGMGGTGPDFVLLNTMKYLQNIEEYPKPKMVIIQWPGEYRKYFVSLHDYLHCHVPMLGSLNSTIVEILDAEWYQKRYLTYDSLQKLHNYNCVQTTKLLWDLAGVKNYHWAWHDDQPNDYNIINRIRTLDKEKARDMAHPGPDVHRQVVEQILEGVKKCLNG